MCDWPFKPVLIHTGPCTVPWHMQIHWSVFLWALFTNNKGLPTLKATKQKRIVGENTDFQLAVVVGQAIAAPLVLTSALLSESKASRTESKEQNVQKILSYFSRGSDGLAPSTSSRSSNWVLRVERTAGESGAISWATSSVHWMNVSKPWIHQELKEKHCAKKAAKIDWLFWVNLGLQLLCWSSSNTSSHYSSSFSPVHSRNLPSFIQTPGLLFCCIQETSKDDGALGTVTCRGKQDLSSSPERGW